MRIQVSDGSCSEACPRVLQACFPRSLRHRVRGGFRDGVPAGLRGRVRQGLRRGVHKALPWCRAAPGMISPSASFFLSWRAPAHPSRSSQTPASGLRRPSRGLPHRLSRPNRTPPRQAAAPPAQSGSRRSARAQAVLLSPFGSTWTRSSWPPACSGNVHRVA